MNIEDETEDLVKLLSMLVEAKNLHLSVFFHKSDLSSVTDQQNGMIISLY